MESIDGYIEYAFQSQELSFDTHIISQQNLLLKCCQPTCVFLLNTAMNQRAMIIFSLFALKYVKISLSIMRVYR